MRKGIALRGTLCRKVIKIVWALGGGTWGGSFPEKWETQMYEMTCWGLPKSLVRKKKRELLCRVPICPCYTSCFPPNWNGRVCFPGKAYWMRYGSVLTDLGHCTGQTMPVWFIWLVLWVLTHKHCSCIELNAVSWCPGPLGLICLSFPSLACLWNIFWLFMYVWMVVTVRQNLCFSVKMVNTLSLVFMLTPDLFFCWLFHVMLKLSILCQ